MLNTYPQGKRFRLYFYIPVIEQGKDIPRRMPGCQDQRLCPDLLITVNHNSFKRIIFKYKIS